MSEPRKGERELPHIKKCEEIYGPRAPGKFKYPVDATATSAANETPPVTLR